MAKVRVIGTYQPERTPLHGLDTRAKIGFLLLMTVAVFAAHSSLSLGICALLLVAALLLARITPMQLAAAMRPTGIVRHPRRRHRHVALPGAALHPAHRR